MFEKNLLEGKRIMVTGGATGLGKSMGKRFLELGALLYICGRREEVLAEASEELRKSTGGTVKTFSCDVRDNQRVNAMIDTIWQDGPLDALVNNAAGNFLCRTEELSIGAFEAVIGIVLMGTIHCTLACGKRWIKDSRKASVLSITTTYAQWGSPYVVPSSVAKAGVLNMTRSLAVEWGKHGIRFNAIAPGPVPTEGAFSRLMPVKSTSDSGKTVRCPMPGLVVSIAVGEGQEVKAGETLAVVEAMKMENVLRAERDGAVKKIHAKPGDSLAVDAVILEFA